MSKRQSFVPIIYHLLRTSEVAIIALLAALNSGPYSFTKLSLSIASAIIVREVLLHEAPQSITDNLCHFQVGDITWYLMQLNPEFGFVQLNIVRWNHIDGLKDDDGV
nr:hypothetical protein Iba_chr09dCG12850 [Ipomoea batatas]